MRRARIRWRRCEASSRAAYAEVREDLGGEGRDGFGGGGVDGEDGVEAYEFQSAEDAFGGGGEVEMAAGLFGESGTLEDDADARAVEIGNLREVHDDAGLIFLDQLFDEPFQTLELVAHGERAGKSEEDDSRLVIGLRCFEGHVSRSIQRVGAFSWREQDHWPRQKPRLLPSVQSLRLAINCRWRCTK